MLLYWETICIFIHRDFLYHGHNWDHMKCRTRVILGGINMPAGIKLKWFIIKLNNINYKEQPWALVVPRATRRPGLSRLTANADLCFVPSTGILKNTHVHLISRLRKGTSWMICWPRRMPRQRNWTWIRIRVEKAIIVRFKMIQHRFWRFKMIQRRFRRFVLIFWLAPEF
jgi:hypothetical protein